MRPPFLVAFMLAMLLAAPAVAAPSYKTDGDCDGFPRIEVTTAPGLCVGLVAQDLGFARGVAVIGDDVYVADMGGWRKGHGRLLRLAKRGRAAPEALLDKLDEPNALLPLADGMLLVGMLGEVFSIDPKAADPRATMKPRVTGLATAGLHPLPALALAPDGFLYINSGSATDHCEGVGGKSPNPCPELSASPPRGAILRVKLGDAPVEAAKAEVFARGLRNSLGLVALPNGQLIAAVNARDAIGAADPSIPDEGFPHDTLDWLQAGADYGWPYCFDENRPIPEYPKYDCSGKTRPTRLLPAHAAPLNLLHYAGPLPGLMGHLLITYHGYRMTGHRIVALALNQPGRPIGEPQEIVWGWNALPNVRPQGAPVALAEMADGSVLITEDHNGTLLRLARAP